MIVLLSLVMGAVPANERAVRLQLDAIWRALERHARETGEYPLTLAGVDDEAGALERVPEDPWGTRIVWLRSSTTRDPGCLNSAGPDRRHGTLDDVRSRCDPEELNPFLLMEAGRRPYPVLDAYGRTIRVIRRRNGTTAWSHGPDGRPDTEDDLVARVRPER